MSSGSYTYMIIWKAQQEAEEAEEARKRWNSYTKEQKEAIMKFDRWYYEYKKQKEEEQYKTICRTFKKTLTPFCFIIDKINCLINFIFDYYYLIFRKCYNFQPYYIPTFEKDILKYWYINEYLCYIDLNNYHLVARILINQHNINFKKLKQIILVKYRHYKSRSMYLRKVYDECEFITEEDKNKLDRIFKKDLIRRY